MGDYLWLVIPLRRGRGLLWLLWLPDTQSGQTPALLLLLRADLPPVVKQEQRRWQAHDESGDGAGHDASLPLTATGGALGLPTPLTGRKSWLRAVLLQAGSGTALTLGTVTEPSSDRLVVIWSNMAAVERIHKAAINGVSVSFVCLSN